MEGGDSLAASFMANVEESVSERECKLYAKGLRSKVKLCFTKSKKKHEDGSGSVNADCSSYHF